MKKPSIYFKPSFTLIFLFFLTTITISAQDFWEQHFSVMGLGSVRWVDHADIDNDGLEDVIIASSAHFSWVKNLGGGRFAQHSLVSASSVVRFGLSDVDTDGDIDAWADGSFYLNDGDGNFTRVNIGVLLSHARAFVDVDADEDEDTVVFNFSTGILSLYLNDGTLNYTLGQELLTDLTLASLNDVKVADVDGDFDADFIVATENGVFLLENNEGIFNASSISNINAGAANYGDLDGDGDLDLAVKNDAEDNVRILFNNGNGSWSAGSVISDCIGNLGHVEIIDIDNDEDLDLLYGRTTTRVTVFENNGSGTFTQGYNINAILPSICHGIDIDGDGAKDVLTYKGNPSTEKPKVSWYPNQNNTFPDREQVTLHFQDNDRPSFAAGDLDNDGDNDLLVQHEAIRTSWNIGDNLLSVPELTAAASAGKDVILKDANEDGFLDVLAYRDNLLLWMINDGTGQFPNEISVGNLSYSTVAAMGAEDLDNDGDLDVLASSYDNDTGSSEAFWMELNTNGTYTQHDLSGSVARPYHFEVADYNNDDLLDIALTGLSTPEVSIFTNLGEGAFESGSVSLISVPKSFHWVDMDQDGWKDILYSETYTDPAVILRRNQGGSFGGDEFLETFLIGTDNTVLCAPADMNLDGIMDIVATVDFMRIDQFDFRSRVAVLLGTGNGNFADPSYLFEYNTYGFDYEYLQIADMNGDGKPDPIMHYFAEGLNVDFANDEFDDITWFENKLNVDPAILLQTVEASCNNNGTYNNDDDDFFDVALELNGVLVSDGYNISSEDGELSLTNALYAETATFTFTPADPSADTYTIMVEDVEDSSIRLELVVDNSFPCSAFESLIDIAVTDISCDPNGTLTDPTDDRINFSLLVATDEFTGDYVLEGIGAPANAGNYNNTTTFFTSAGTAGNGDLELVLSDADDSNLNTPLLISDPGSCATTNTESPNHQLTVKTQPNPFTDQFLLEIEGLTFLEDLEIQLFRPDGSLVVTYPVSTNRLYINAEKLAAGMYLYTLLDQRNGQIIKFGRIVKL
ncbi:MAG: VCBS repeat-containing protein [Bacteroidota bacterium]